MMLRPSPRRSFYVAIIPSETERGWCWEIRRKRRPMGVRLRESGFTTYRSAMLAGRDALEEFLNGLSLDPVLGTSSNGVAGTKIARSRDPALYN